MESEKHHEIRAVNDYESWGFDLFDSPDSMDTTGDWGSYLDDTNPFGDWGLSFDDPSNFQVAQIPEGINVESPVENSLDDQAWNMDKLPEVQDLQPLYQEDKYQNFQTLKALNDGEQASYLQLDNFNNRIAPSLTVSDETVNGNNWSPAFTDERNGGPGIAAAAGNVNLGWNAQFEGPQMIYDFDH